MPKELAEIQEAPQEAAPDEQDSPTIDEADLDPETGLPWSREAKAVAKRGGVKLGKPLPKVDTAPDKRTALGLGILGIKGFMKAPGEEKAIEWTERAARRLLPEAMAVLATSLRSDNEKNRLDAAEKVLKMNGVSQKQALDGGNATIVVNFGGGGLPEWLSPVVNAKPVKKDE